MGGVDVLVCVCVGVVGKQARRAHFSHIQLFLMLGG